MSVDTTESGRRDPIVASPPDAAAKPRPTTAPRYFATVPPQEILPIVNSRYESSVRGIYVIGDVTGLPLVKVAANQGVEVMARMEADGVYRQRSQDDERLDLVIIGGGPAGLSAAIEAEKRGLRYVVLERNKIASTVRSFPPGKKVYAEPQFVKNTSELDVDEDLDKDDFLARVQSLVEQKRLKMKEDTEVLHVRRRAERQFEVETKAGKVFPTRQVLVAIGRQGQPRLLTCPGADDASKVTYRLHTPEDYDGKKSARFQQRPHRRNEVRQIHDKHCCPSKMTGFDNTEPGMKAESVSARGTFCRPEEYLSIRASMTFLHYQQMNSTDCSCLLRNHQKGRDSGGGHLPHQFGLETSRLRDPYTGQREIDDLKTNAPVGQTSETELTRPRIKRVRKRNRSSSPMKQGQSGCE